MKKTLLATCAVVLVAAAPAFAQVDFTRYVALGDSLTAGYASGGLTQFYQERSYPARLAGQAGTPDFQMPLVTEPGMAPLMRLESLVPLRIVAPSVPPGAPINATLARPYNNLGIPGSNLYDLLFTHGNIQNLLAGNTDNVMHDLILRDPRYTALEQGIGLSPTFVTLWIGNNDFLPAALAATPIEGVTMTPVATFQQMYPNALGALVQNTTADIVAFTLPYATAIPFVTTVKPYVDVPGVGRVPFIGSNGVLPADALLTLRASGYLAQGIGIPVAIGGTGLPLPEDLQIVGGQVVPGVVLRAEEVAVINGRVDAYNDIITATAASLDVPVLDVNAIFAAISAGHLPTYGGIELSPSFLTGGIFSYDGVHPQSIGYAIIATELIDLVNEELNAGIPQLDMYEILTEPGTPEAVALGADKSFVFDDDAMQRLMDAFPLLGRPHVAGQSETSQTE